MTTKREREEFERKRAEILRGQLPWEKKLFAISALRQEYGLEPANKEN
jgi:hypothetical protein